MAAKAEPPASTLYLLLTAPAAEPSVYLAPAGAGWALPSITLPLPHGPTFGAGAITAAACAAFGLELEFVLCLANLWPSEGVQAEGVVALNLLPASPAPPALHLVPIAAAQQADWPRPDHRAHLAALVPPLPTNRVPWAYPGFLAEAQAWIAAQLAAHALALTGPLEVRRHWSLSLLLRAPTAAGDFYFKAVPPLFRQEPALTADLGRRFPGRVPAVLAYAADRRWMLMRAFAGDPLQTSTDGPRWLAALQGYAELQTALAPHSADLLALGCPDRRASVLAGQVADVLAATDAMRIDQPRGLTTAQAAQLGALGPALVQACRAFAALPLPATLEHGDLHGNNIALAPGGGFVYFDWTDGCLAPPFFGLPPFLENAPAELHAALADAYAAPWRAYADAATLQRAQRLARPLSDLHIALSYVWIHQQTEPGQRYMLAGALPYFLRELLKHWAEVEPEL